ncbi:MAG: hypothetical protein QW343_01075 [Candidatus Norongarragalinales archaeon]
MANPRVGRLMHPVKKVPLDIPQYVETNLEEGGHFPGIKAHFVLHPLVNIKAQQVLKRRVETFLNTLNKKLKEELANQGVTEAQYWPIQIRQLDIQAETHEGWPYKKFGIEANAGFIFLGGGANGEKSRYNLATQQIALTILKRHFRIARRGVKGIVNRVNARYAKVPC